MKTKKLIKEADELLKKIENSKKREKYLESLDFELNLVDDLLKEIKSRKLNEGFLDFLQGFVDGFAKFLGAGLKEIMGLSEEKIDNSRDKAFKAAGKKPYKLEPNKKPDDLIIWASSQGFVKDNLEKAKEKMMLSESLRTPIPDESDEEELEEKWGKGGESANILEDLSTASGYIVGTLQILVEKEPALKVLKPAYDEINAMSKNKDNEDGAVGVLKLWEKGVAALGEGGWATAMKKAEILSADKEWFQESQMTIDAEGPINLAKEIRSHVQGEITRLESALKEMQANQGDETGKESVDAGSGTEETGDTGTGAF